jgi:hypothetical protein
MASGKVYIHELIDIIGHNRAKYMHHMTANWVPVANRERNMLCYGVWGTVGSTGAWPQTVNMWELTGWDGLAANFEHELSHPTQQDPALAEWWAQAAQLRRGGVDRILVPDEHTRSIEELTAAGVGGVGYAHELVTLPAGCSGDYLSALRDVGQPAVEAFGLELVGAFAVAMCDDTECIVIWGFRDWQTWGRFEAAEHDDRLAAWRARQRTMDATKRRILMVDAPLSPMRIGRQPEESDRRPLDEI